MKTRWKGLIIAGAVLAGLSGTAAARDNVSFSLAFGVPAYTYYAPPPPVYYAPPPPVYYAPAPAYYYGPPAVSVYYRDGWRHNHRHHHHNYR